MTNIKLTGVQGLRAIAVIAVLVFHFYPNSIPFGYLGVDIFFVISGFIVTYIYGTNVFSLKKIYYFLYKRFLRIYPSLILVLLFVIIISILFDRTENLKKSGLEIIFSLLSVVNLYFSLFNSKYFEVDITNNPLLHLWSISTEMQFYLIFPLFILLFGSKLKILKRVAVFMIVSFSFLTYINIIEFQDFSNYYLLYTRIWQFSVGIFAFYIYQNKNKLPQSLVRNWSPITYFSFALLITCLFFQLPFYLNSILATFLSGKLVLFSALNNNSIPLLSNKFVQFIGELSYSIYLWHWVIMYLIKKFYYWNFNLSIVGIVLTFIFSYLSYNYWEVRFRNITQFSIHRKYFSYLGVVLSAVFLLALLSQSTLFSNRFEEEKQQLSNYKLRDGFTNLEKECILDYGEHFSQWPNLCKKVDSTKNVLFWGDSHAVALAEAFKKFNKDESRVTSLLSISACPPILNLNPNISPNKLCAVNNKYVFEYIKSSKTKNVVLSSRWYIYANKEWYESGLKSLQSTIFKLKELGVENIYLLASSPEWSESLPESLWRSAILNSNIPQYLPNQKINVLNDINFNLKEMAVDAKINYVDPIEIWCDDDNCKTYNSMNFYLNQIDTDHLSVGSAAEILKLFKLI